LTVEPFPRILADGWVGLSPFFDGVRVTMPLRCLTIRACRRIRLSCGALSSARCWLGPLD